eukprot:430427_1
MASYEVVNNIAIITCRNPPVNQLSYALRLGLFNGLESALSDPNVIAIVITADGKTFIAGADIKEFSNGMAFKRPLTEFIEALDNATKPVVAAIHGTALGGGFEVALATHYRIGTNRSFIGLPEVNIGILPGAGGTQRLPRLIGPLLAAEMITSGVHIGAQIAYKRGILDDIINIKSNDNLQTERKLLRQAAIQFALNICDKPFENRIISKRSCPKMDNMFYKQIEMMINKRSKGYLAPKLCLAAVRAAQESKTFSEGMKKERELFIKLLTNPQSRALQHIFFAQRQCRKIPGLNINNLAKPINSVGIIGCGTMGGGILMCFVEVGIPVIILETEKRFLDIGLNIIKSNWMRQVKKGKLSLLKYNKYISFEMIKPTLNYNDLSCVDIVIEAVFENLKIKQNVFKKLDKICKYDCILASNTSAIPIEQIAKVTNRPEKVIGTHFFAPANKMQLIENVRFNGGADNITCATVQNMAKLIKKKGVLVRSCPGFVGNRMYGKEGMEAGKLLLEGAMPIQIDGVCTDDIGCKMGIIQVWDLSGLDLGYRARKEKGITSKRYALSDILCENNRRGLKSGKGMYDYPHLPQSRQPVKSKFVENLIIKISNKYNIKRREISRKEIKERLFYPMINEGFNILNDGIAIRPSDIDVVLVFGYGFPAFRGGPMFWAENQIGLKKLYNTICKYYKKYPNDLYWKPSPLLKKCVEEKISLTKYWKKYKTHKKISKL